MKMHNKKNGLLSVTKKIVKQQKVLTIALILVGIGAIISSLIPPLILEYIVNELVNRKCVIVELALLYFAILIISGLFDAGKEILITIFGQKITHGLRSEMCRKLTALPAAYFTQNEAGTITSRFVNDVDTVEALFNNGIISMFVDVCKVISIIAIVYTKSIGLGIMLMTIAPVLFFFTRTVQKRMLVAQKLNRVAIGRVNNHIPETISNIRTIHCLEKEKYMEERYDEKIQESYRAVEKSNFFDSIYSPVIIMISTILIAAIMILSAIGGNMQAFFGMSVGTSVAVISYISKVFEPIESIGMEIQNIQSAVAGIDRINEFLFENEQEKTDGTINFETIQKDNNYDICMENVSFSYDGNKNIIENLSFTIKKGEMVTLAGRTGAGKSTIFKILLGLYYPQKGRVLIFGQEASKIPNKEKRRLFGYVEQSFHMVPGTIAQQISMFDDEITQENIEKATSLVGLHDCIMKLPEGYSTDCRSAAFSQGQLQLLSIARAVVVNPPVILLDEITANLDSITELEIIHALERAAKGRTVISISHRLYENIGSRLINI